MEQSEPATTPITDEEIDAVLYEARGDAREAIRMLLHDLAVMAQDADRLVSQGCVRGRAPRRRAG